MADAPLAGSEQPALLLISRARKPKLAVSVEAEPAFASRQIVVSAVLPDGTNLLESRNEAKQPLLWAGRKPMSNGPAQIIREGLFDRKCLGSTALGTEVGDAA